MGTDVMHTINTVFGERGRLWGDQGERCIDYNLILAWCGICDENDFVRISPNDLLIRTKGKTRSPIYFMYIHRHGWRCIYHGERGGMFV